MPDYRTKEGVLQFAQQMLDRGEPVDRVKAFVQRAKSRLEKNLADQDDAQRLSFAQKTAVFGERAYNAATFGLGGLTADAVVAGVDPNQSFADLRRARDERGEQLGTGLSVAADLVGGLATGGASLSAIKNMANMGRFAKVGLAAGDAALQGGVTGASEGLKDVTADAFSNAGRAGLVGAGAGVVLGGAIGAAGGKIAERAIMRRLGKEMVEKGYDPAVAKAVTRQLSGATEDDIARALQRLSDIERRGIRADAVMAADVLGPPAQDVVRNAANISPDARRIATERVRGRDADIVRRSRADIADAAGYTPAQMDASEYTMLAERNAKAKQSYLDTAREGAEFDALPSRVTRLPAPETAPQPKPSLRDAIDEFRTRLGLSVKRKEGTSMQQSAREALERHGALDEGASPSLQGQPSPLVDDSALPLNYADVMRVTDAAANDPVAQRTFNALVKENPKKFADADLRDFKTMLRTYQKVNKEIRAIEKSAAPDYNRLDGLYSAKAAMGESLAARSKSFRQANADYFEASKGLEAYRAGQEAVTNRLPSEMRRSAADIRAADQELWQKGGIDRWAEELGAGPNPDLGAAATSRQSVGRMTTGSQNAADKLKLLVGDEGYQRAVQNAKDEALFAQTSNALQGNSTTARQQVGMNDALNVMADVAGGFSMNPAWWATMTGRRLAGDNMGRLVKALSRKQLTRASDALTQQGSANTRHTLQLILEEIARRRAAQRGGAVFAGRARSAGARMAGDDS